MIMMPKCVKILTDTLSFDTLQIMLCLLNNEYFEPICAITTITEDFRCPIFVFLENKYLLIYLHHSIHESAQTRPQPNIL